MDPVAEVVARSGGVAALAELKDVVSSTSIDSALGAGSLVRLHRTKVVLPSVGAARAAALRAGGQVSHLSAALCHGWKVLHVPMRPMIAVLRGAKVRGADGVEVHWCSRRVDRPGDPTSPIDTVIDCARDLPFADALAVADSALRARAVTRRQLLDAAQKSPRTGRRKAIRVAECATRLAANPFESGLRAIALDVPGFTAVAQCQVLGTLHVDVGDESLSIALEADSFEFHAIREAFEYDVRRYTAMTRNGWLVARFTWDDVMHKPEYVAAVVGDLVALRG